jgi:glycosyltransferase involved in cell wall biosynthesis
MKILRVTASMNPAYGGPPAGIRISIQALEAFGIRNEVASCDSPGAEWIGRDAFPLHALGPGKFGYAYSPRFSDWLSKNLARFDAVVVHGLWLWPGLASFRAWKKAGLEAPTRFFVMPHGMLDPWFQRDRSRRVKALRNSIYWWLAERSVVNGADAVFFTCEEELRLARQTFAGYHPRREMDVGYGIPDPPPMTENLRRSFSKECPRWGGSQYILFLGRIHPKKGVDILVEAYRRVLEMQEVPREFPDLVIAGPGWESKFGRRVESLIGSNPKIHTTGMLEGAAKWGALHGCEAFILPSHQENFGIAVVEALACNKRVLVSKKVNIWREISSDDAGCVADDDLAGTVQLLESWRDGISGHNPFRFRDCFRRRFGVESAALKMASILKDSMAWR